MFQNIYDNKPINDKRVNNKRNGNAVFLMPMIVRLIFVCFLIVFFPAVISISQAAVNLTITPKKLAGYIAMKTGEVERTNLSGETTQLGLYDAVYENDLIITKANSSAKIHFSDNTIFILTDNASFMIDHYVFDTNKGLGSSVLNIVQGKFLYVSGIIARTHPKSARIQTSIGSVGIRGTVISGDILSGSDGRFDLSLIDGQIDIEILGREDPLTIADNFVNLYGGLEGEGMLHIQFQNLGSTEIIRRDIQQFSSLNHDEITKVEGAIKGSLSSANLEEEAKQFNLAQHINEAMKMTPIESAPIDVVNENEEHLLAYQGEIEFYFTSNLLEEDHFRQWRKTSEELSEGQAIRQGELAWVKNKGLVLKQAYENIHLINNQPAIVYSSAQNSGIKSLNNHYQQFQFASFGRWLDMEQSSLTENEGHHIITSHSSWWVDGDIIHDYPLTGSASYSGPLYGDYFDGTNTHSNFLTSQSQITLDADFGHVGGPKIDGSLNFILNDDILTSSHCNPCQTNHNLHFSTTDFNMSGHGDISFSWDETNSVGEGTFFGHVGITPLEVGGSFEAININDGILTGIFIAKKY